MFLPLFESDFLLFVGTEIFLDSRAFFANLVIHLDAFRIMLFELSAFIDFVLVTLALVIKQLLSIVLYTEKN